MMKTMMRLKLRVCFVLSLLALFSVVPSEGLAFVTRIMTGFGNPIGSFSSSFTDAFAGTATGTASSHAHVASGSALLAHNGKLTNRRVEVEVTKAVSSDDDGVTTLPPAPSASFGFDDDTVNHRCQLRDLVYERNMQRLNGFSSA
jgi:hypothetical protein